MFRTLTTMCAVAVVIASLAFAAPTVASAQDSGSDAPRTLPTPDDVRDRVQDAADQLWQKLDTNGDDAIDLAELQAAKDAVADRMQQAFDEADADNDGRVTRDEARAHAQAKAAELKDRIRERMQKMREELGNRFRRR